MNEKELVQIYKNFIDVFMSSLDNRQSVMFQLILWLHDHSLHDPEHGIHCPDYSCCDPSIQTPLHEKLKLIQALDYEIVVENSDNYINETIAVSFEDIQTEINNIMVSEEMTPAYAMSDQTMTEDDILH